MLTVNIQYNWIQTAYLWTRKRPLYQLSHNHEAKMSFKHPHRDRGIVGSWNRSNPASRGPKKWPKNILKEAANVKTNVFGFLAFFSFWPLIFDLINRSQLIFLKRVFLWPGLIRWVQNSRWHYIQSYAQINHFNWSKLVTWLATSNHRAFNRVLYCTLKFVHDIGSMLLLSFLDATNVSERPFKVGQSVFRIND